MNSIELSHGGTLSKLDDKNQKRLLRLLSNKGSKEFSLNKIKTLMEPLGNPHEKFPVIHITGTNGKGSVSCATSSILGGNGKRVILTISPHLSLVNERVIIDGYPISTQQLLEHLDIIDYYSEKFELSLSLHEIMTIVALLEGVRVSVDFGVFEVGLGGRLDSTNIVSNPAIGVITTVALDHLDLLGDSIEAIAVEKAGIIKSSMKAVVVGEVSESAYQVIEQIASHNLVPVFRYGRDFSVEAIGGINKKEPFIFKFKNITQQFFSPFKGAHQSINMACALMVGHILEIDPIKSKNALINAFWPGRLESIVNETTGHTFILDSGHNPAGIDQIVKYILSQYEEGVTCVFGCLNTKNWKEMVDKLVPITRYWALLSPRVERAVKSEEVADYLSCFNINSKIIDREINEIDLMKSIMNLPNDRPILVIGSMYMLGRVRDIIKEELKIIDQPYWKLS